MIYNSFMYYNEADLLEIHLEEMWDVVDCFILTEAPFTQRCDPKPLYYKMNEGRFRDYEDKIFHIVVPEEKYDRFRYSYNERLQRNHFACSGEIWYEDDDVFILGDVDEIFSSDVIRKKRLLELPFEYDLVQTNMSLHNFYVNYVSKDVQWNAPLIVSGKTLRNNRPSGLRRCAYHNFEIPLVDPVGRVDVKTKISLDNCGWHFSWMGSKDDMIEKIMTRCDKEDIEDFLDAGDFDYRVSKGITFDYLVDNIKLVVDNDFKLPRYLINNREKFKHLFHNGGSK